MAGIRPITNCHQLKQKYQKNLKNKRIEVESEVPNEELELLAQSQTLIKRFQDLALCTKNSSDIEKVINKALKQILKILKSLFQSRKIIFINWIKN